MSQEPPMPNVPNVDSGDDVRWSLDGQPGPAKRLPARHAQSMIQAALLAMDAPAADIAAPAPVTTRRRATVHTRPAPIPPASPEPSQLRGRRLVWLLAAAIVVTAGAASAGIYSWLGQAPAHQAPALREAHEIGQTSTDPAPDPAPEPAPAPAPDSTSAPGPAPDTAELPVLAEESPGPSSGELLKDDGDGASDEPRAEPPRRTRQRPSRPADARTQRRAGSRSPAPATPTAPATPPASTTSEDLMKQANEQRRARQWQAAEVLYQRVVREHPGTSAAYVAAIAAASIRLDHLGDARGALRLYQSALASGVNRVLAEEARWGLAEAHRALGDHAREARALQDFVARHPGSPLIPQARARLGALGAAGTQP
jgi:Tetratricopeptide repeat